MRDFDDFDTVQTRNAIVSRILMKNGGFHIHGPNDREMESRSKEALDTAMEAIRAYHEWVSAHR